MTMATKSFSTRFWRIASLVAIFSIISTHGFVNINHPTISSNRLSSSSITRLRASNAKEIFDLPIWASVQKELDQVPIFACANIEGKPLKYQIDLSKHTGSEKKSFDVPLFYTHVDDALLELENARKNTNIPMDISPYPLGEIFVMWASDEAVIIPNKSAILQAGAPPNANPMGQSVPLFACMEIAQENAQGKPVLPLFFDLADANAAVAQAVSFDGGKVEDFEVVCLSLSGAVEMFAKSSEDSMAFEFVPPTSSIKHIRENSP